MALTFSRLFSFISLGHTSKTVTQILEKWFSTLAALQTHLRNPLKNKTPNLSLRDAGLIALGWSPGTGVLEKLPR